MGKYWFKRKRYGYGWVPMSLADWLLTLGFIVVVLKTTIIYLFLINDLDNPDLINVVYFLMVIVLEILVFIFIITKVSPPAKWRWGKQDNDDPELDW